MLLHEDQLLLRGGWPALRFLVFSFAEGTFHPYYSTALAPAIGALAGMGWRRADVPGARTWAAPGGWWRWTELSDPVV